MKLFPYKILTVKMSHDRLTTLNGLKHLTKLTDRLVSVHTKKEFIGQVTDSGFKIISSEIGRGAFCVFEGELQDTYGHLEIRIHTAFKIMTSILMLMPIAALVFDLFTQGIEKSVEMLAPVIMGILIIRFVFIEICFRFISKTGLNKLERLIGLNKHN